MSRILAPLTALALCVVAQAPAHASERQTNLQRAYHREQRSLRHVSWLISSGYNTTPGMIRAAARMREDLSRLRTTIRYAR